MNGLPKDFDAVILIGHSLEMVCFSAYQIYLHFNQQMTITIESDFSYQADNGAAPAIVKPPVASSELMQSVGKTVKNAAGGGDGTLTITFDDGHILKCYDASKQYESYQIKLGERVIIV